MQRLLLIDDDESNRITLALLLEDEGFEVAVASSVAEGASTLRSSTTDWDAVLLDSILGDGQGCELVPLIRERVPRAKIVAVSGGSVEDWARVRIDAALPKGMRFPEFVSGLRTLLMAAD
jgi:two-component system response regulator RegA